MDADNSVEIAGEIAAEIADMGGDLALPRSNGELAFSAPWEGRAFGIAVALNESGAYEWGEFQRRLAAEIAAAPPGYDASDYYERWLASLESLLVELGLLTHAELDARAAAYEDGEIEDE